MSETRTRRRISDRHHSNSSHERMRGNKLRSRSQTSTSDKSGHYRIALSSNDTSGYESMDAGIPGSPPPSYESLNQLFVDLPDEDEAYISSDSLHCSTHPSCRSFHNLPVCEITCSDIEDIDAMTLNYTMRNGEPYLPDIIAKAPRRSDFSTKKMLVNGRITEYELLPVITPEQAKDCLVKFYKGKFTKSNKFAKKCHILEITQEVAFRCKLLTYTESRDVVNKAEKYKGEKLDKLRRPVPSVWTIPAGQPEFFKDYKMAKKIPHTEELKKCQNCKGSGQCTCTRCHGARTVHCYRCHGNGTIHTTHGKHITESCGQCSGGYNTCGYCRGHGHETCLTCDGDGRLKHYKQLEVTWETCGNRYVDKVDGVPQRKILKISGHEIYREQGEKLEPIKEEDLLHKNVRRFSKKALEEHFLKSENFGRKILQQKCTVDIIPINVVRCAHKDTEYHFHVIGKENKVNAPNYPGNAFGIASFFQ